MTEAAIFEDLKRDHDEHRRLLSGIAAATDAGERRRLFEQLRVAVSGHAAAEEESLYATMLGKPDLRDDARHSVSEHKEVDDMLTELFALDPASPEWLDKFQQMRTRYDHHITEEEEEMFPEAAAKLDAATEDRLATIYETRKPLEEADAAATDPTAEEHKD